MCYPPYQDVILLYILTINLFSILNGNLFSRFALGLPKGLPPIERVFFDYKLMIIP